MNRRAWVWMGLLLLLCALVPFSSTQPDGLQRALGLPGGEGTLGKAVIGVTVAGGIFFFIWAFRRWRRKRWL